MSLTQNTNTDFVQETAHSADGTVISYHKIGVGPALVINHGTLRAAMDYEELARILASSFTVYLMDRRGRGDSGPQGEQYGMAKEVEDLKAILEKTGATLLFGHSFGGLVCLELAQAGYSLEKLALYEPAVSINGSIPASSVPEIRQALADNNYPGAFVGLLKMDESMTEDQLSAFAQSVSESPMWPSMRDLMPTIPAEIGVVGELDSTYQKYKTITIDTLIIRGDSTTPDAVESTNALSKTLPNNTVTILPGVGHNGPDMEAPEAVAKVLTRFFTDN